MPTLHRYKDRPGYFVRGVSNGNPVAFTLSSEGEQYLTETLGLTDGAKFAADTMKLLYKRKWASPIDPPPPAAEEYRAVTSPAATATAATSAGKTPSAAPPPSTVAAAVRYDANPVVYFGMVQLRLAANDHVLLDQAVEDVVRGLAKTEAIILGPLPLPVHIEPYVVLREKKQVYELRLYQRLLQVRNPRRQTMDVMTQFALPREVDVKVEMLTPGA